MLFSSQLNDLNTMEGLNNFLKKLRQDLVNLLPKKNYILFQNGYDFTLNLIQIAKNSNIMNLTDKLKKYLDTYYKI